MLVKDEADVVGYTIRHLLRQVNEVIVRDNGSTDGTSEQLVDLVVESGGRVKLASDGEVGYYQAEKTTELARLALEQGHAWVVPCDADEFWYSTDGRPIRDFLAGLAPDVAYVQAPLFNHLPTGLDAPASRAEQCPWEREDLADSCACGWPDTGPCARAENPDAYHEIEPNPFRRIGWRQREHGALPKVACRLRPGLEIRQGNHSAYAPGGGVAVGGLVVRHFSWRSEAQYLRKIRNGEVAYAATTLAPSIGAHWRMWEGKPDDAVVDHFRTWFHVADPRADDSLIYDPAPGA